MTRDDFEAVVEKALGTLPPDIAKHLNNIEIVIEDAPKNSKATKSLLLGLYEGVPLNARSDSYYAGVLPDKITLFQKNIEEISSDEEEMIEQIRKTLLHEIGHYFGMDDKKLRKLGY